MVKGWTNLVTKPAGSVLLTKWQQAVLLRGQVVFCLLQNEAGLPLFFYVPSFVPPASLVTKDIAFITGLFHAIRKLARIVFPQDCLQNVDFGSKSIIYRSFDDHIHMLVGIARDQPATIHPFRYVSEIQQTVKTFWTSYCSRYK